MRAYTSMPTYEFVEMLRAVAIAAKASPLVIDQIDALSDGPTEKDIEERIADAVAEAGTYDEGNADGTMDQYLTMLRIVEKFALDFDMEAADILMGLLKETKP